MEAEPETDEQFVGRIRTDLENARGAYYVERGRGILDSYDDVERLLSLVRLDEWWER